MFGTSEVARKTSYQHKICFQGMCYHLTDHSKPLMGTRKWAAEHQKIYPDEDELRKECEEYMAEFDEREKLKLQREKEMAETPDEVMFSECGHFVSTYCLQYTIRF